MYSFEINPAIFKILERNLRVNCDLRRFDLRNVGILDKAGNVDISEVDFQNAGLTKITEINGSEYPVDSLDNLLEGVENIVLIKIDIEGFELEVIRGAEKLLRKHRPVIFAELATENEFRKFCAEVAKFG